MQLLLASFFFNLALRVVLGLPFTKKLYVRGTGTDISVISHLKFCSYLPPNPGESISATEDDATPFCTDPNLAENAKVFPPEFIQSVHFYSTPYYVQVTGTIDHTKYNIPTDDGGGQYDNKDLPDGTCNGYEYWVNLIEPDSDLFCVRCCQRKQDCNLGISTYGCQRIVPGNYN